MGSYHKKSKRKRRKKKKKSRIKSSKTRQARSRAEQIDIHGPISTESGTGVVEQGRLRPPAAAG